LDAENGLSLADSPNPNAQLHELINRVKLFIFSNEGRASHRISV
jgi:hypothetical protein